MHLSLAPSDFSTSTMANETNSYQDVSGDNKTLHMRKLELMSNPSFVHIKDLVISAPGNHTSDKHALTCPLITWLTATPEVVTQSVQEAMSQRKRVRSTFGSIDLSEEMINGLQWLTERITGVSTGAGNSERTTAVLQPDEFYNAAVASRETMKLFTFHLCAQYMLHFYENLEDNRATSAEKRIPLSAIRVRDIALYRYLRSELEKAGMSDIHVMTDNVLHPSRKEYTAQAIYAFCGTCFKVATTHSRCAGCKVSMSC